MNVIFDTIIPIFLIIIGGNILRRSPLIDSAGWSAIEELAYWILYPALTFIVIMRADFEAIQFTAIAVPFAMALAAICVIMLCTLLLLQRMRLIAPWEFSSVFQSAIHWNGYISVVIAGKMFGEHGLSIMVFIVALFMLPLNGIVALVTVMHADEPKPKMDILRFLRGNPVLLAAFAALACRASGLSVPSSIHAGLDLLGRAAFGVGLLSVGASIKITRLWSVRFPLWFPILVKLLVFPVLMMAVAIVTGVKSDNLIYLTLCVAVPATTHGYLLARQLGGDAQLYAVITAWQTALSFITIPLMLWCATQLAGG
ncbi:AEC family transporter [Limoniibacter endophyticus]|uniref:Transporter n=1 Tax=Limoniibacter endophyticus TaxID=1565040 RepID=A0A8J3GG13_9HYPH|nr:AEC family transporter [Limoniibacter endophyticus]GHC62270.1 transporter [Limoniibacter endophyticus]